MQKLRKEAHRPILDFVEYDILSIGLFTRSAMNVSKKYGRKCEYCCQYHLDWKVKLASKIAISGYFSNKQKQTKDCVREYSVERFETRQRSNQFILRHIYLVLYFFIIKIDCIVRVIGLVFP